jgi:16S rRNA G966 N2-methylase RsmD
MEEPSMHQPLYLYTIACHEDEVSLCSLEMRMLFNASFEDVQHELHLSRIALDPSRSPFLRERIEVYYEAGSFEELARRVEGLCLPTATFKVHFAASPAPAQSPQLSYDEQRRIERELGDRVQGIADIKKPDLRYGVTVCRGRWYFGPYAKNEAVWLKHMDKPRQYSIALSTRVARALANIAVPQPHGVRAIDPCCGIGTVLLEALSMGIDIVGRDHNPIVVQGARENLAYYGYEAPVAYGGIEDAAGRYDAAIIDLPYNHVSRISGDAQRSILLHARRLADRMAVVTVQPIDELLTEIGWTVIDRGTARKGSFVRQILVCR